MTQAKNLLERSEKNYKNAKILLKEGKYSQSLDQLHDAIENILKSILSYYDVKYPPRHNVSRFIPEVIHKIPENEASSYIYREVTLPSLFIIHNILCSIRNYVRYGYKDIPSEKMFNKDITNLLHDLVDIYFPLIKGFVIEFSFKKKLKYKV